jgi:hypothetical protein
MRPKAVGAMLVAVAALVGVAGATAQDEPQTLASATAGTLHVTTGIIVSRTAVDLRGVWSDRRFRCSVSRKLRIHAEVNYIPFHGKPRRFARNGVFTDANCAEGGPNVGYTITAKSLKLACLNGSWKPARYDFVASTTEPTRNVRALADLSWVKRARC